MKRRPIPISPAMELLVLLLPAMLLALAASERREAAYGHGAAAAAHGVTAVTANVAGLK